MLGNLSKVKSTLKANIQARMTTFDLHKSLDCTLRMQPIHDTVSAGFDSLGVCVWWGGGGGGRGRGGALGIDKEVAMAHLYLLRLPFCVSRLMNS